MLRAFRHRDFTLYVLAGFVSNLGLWFQRVGVQWLVWSLTGSYAWLGAIAMAEAVTTMLLLPLFGTVVDRADRLTMAKRAQIMLMALGGTFAALTLTDVITIAILFGLMVVQGLVAAFWTPIRMAMPPSLVPREDLSSAIGVGAIFFNVAQFTGPALSAVIISLLGSTRLGIGWLFALNGLSFLSYYVVLHFIKLRYLEHRQGTPVGFLADFKAGLAYVVQRRGFALFMILMMASMLLMRAYRELLAGIAGGEFGQGAQGFAMLQSAAGVGGFLGSVLVANLGGVEGKTKWVLLAAWLTIAIQFVLAGTDVFWVAIGAVSVLTATASFMGIGGQVLMQSAIHGTMRGRVMSLWAVALRGGPALGAWLMGLVTEAWSINVALTGAATIYLCIMVWMTRQHRLLAKTMESPPPDELPGEAVRN